MVKLFFSAVVFKSLRIVFFVYRYRFKKNPKELYGEIIRSVCRCKYRE